MPKNLEGYYQEIGRAGRDGTKAKALLFHSYADVLQLRRFIDGTTNEQLQIAKLERMKQFSEATSCRRKILLSYFGELLAENCGNCDVCKNPPEFFNGAVIAQKALSVITRLREAESMGVIIDVLRGAKNATTLEKHYDQLPSYGIGTDISWKDWQHYIIQLIDQGYCEIAFHKHNALRLTQFSKEVLFNGQEVQMTKPIDRTLKQEEQKEKTKKSKKTDTLFERLRLLRLKISQEENIPAYLIFSDATLKEIETERPMGEADFKQISGVGKRKMEVYGEEFIAEINAFMAEKKKKPKKSDTAKVTYEMYKKGMSIEAIATARDIKGPTVFSHLSKLYSEGKDIDMYQYVTKEEVNSVKKAKLELDSPEGLKPYFEHFKEELAYSKIRLALTILERENR
ncbi:MAG: ATP-dependent DNA helicase RecQ [Psychroserpens sp.]|jgi:ATP-dependent DNA helicase RecQ